MLRTGRVVVRLTLDAQVEEMNVEEKSNQGQWHRLWLIPETSEPLDFVSAEILDEPDVRFADEQTRFSQASDEHEQPFGSRFRSASAKPLGALSARLRRGA